MKILYLNIYEGCIESSRFKKLIAFIHNAQPDIVGLSELNTWDKKNHQRTKYFQKLTRLPYRVFAHTNSGYHVGLFSKKPYIKAYSLTNGFNTGMVKARFAWRGIELSCVVTHLHHKNEDKRLEEIKIILGKLKPNEPTILMGDFNMLSKHDPLNKKKLLAAFIKQRIVKFGSRTLRTNVSTLLERKKFIDLVRLHSTAFEYSVPTTYNKDPAHCTKLRLDYAFATQNIAQYVTTAKIIRTKETNYLSDHFPILITLP